MRFIYKILIGLIIFNGVLIAFSPFFPASTESKHAIDVTGDDDITQYGGLDQGLFGDVWGTALSVGGVVFGASLLLGVLAKQVALFVGIGAFIAIITGLWSITNGVVVRLVNYPIVNTLVTLIIIIIGIVGVLSVVEMLNAQRGAD